MTIWIIARRELSALFTQPIAYIVAGVILALCGFIFADGLASYQLAVLGGQPVPPPTMANVLGFFVFIALFVSPAITMRLLAEEQKSGTIELLLTLPVRDVEVVLGKFLAAVLYYLLILAFTLLYPVVLLRFGNPDIGPIITSYVGVILSLSVVLALGLLASALSENQLVAYILGVGFTLALYLTTSVAQSLASNPTAQTILTELSLFEHTSRFPVGLVLAKDVAYFVGVTAVALFAATRVLESRRWR